MNLDLNHISETIIERFMYTQNLNGPNLLFHFEMSETKLYHLYF